VPETDRTWTSTPRNNLGIVVVVGNLDYPLQTIYCEPILHKMAGDTRSGSGNAPQSQNTPEVRKNKKESRGVAGAVKTWLGMSYT
jgi:hypothetical protein